MARSPSLSLFPKSFIVPLLFAFLLTIAIIVTNGFSQNQDVRSRAFDSGSPYGTQCGTHSACAGYVRSGSSCDGNKVNTFLDANCREIRFVGGCQELCTNFEYSEICYGCASGNCRRTCFNPNYGSCNVGVWSACVDASLIPTVTCGGTRSNGSLYCCNNDQCRLSLGAGYVCNTTTHSCYQPSPTPTRTLPPFDPNNPATWDGNCQLPGPCNMQYCKLVNCKNGSSGTYSVCRSRNISDAVACGTQL